MIKILQVFQVLNIFFSVNGASKVSEHFMPVRIPFFTSFIGIALSLKLELLSR